MRPVNQMVTPNKPGNVSYVAVPSKLKRPPVFGGLFIAISGDSPCDFFREADLEAVRLAEAFAVGDEGRAVGREVTAGLEGSREGL